MITLEFDGKKRTLSYGINDDWFGVAYSRIPPGGYKLGVSSVQKGVVIDFVVRKLSTLIFNSDQGRD